MRSIFKYPLRIIDKQIISLRGGHPLSVGVQLGQLRLWAITDDDERVVPTDWLVEILGTGHPFGTRDPATFVGTVLMENDALVWHVFARPA